MTVMVFSVLDRAAARFDLPFFARSRQEACRNLAYNLSANPDSLMTRYADQYALYFIGEYDDESAIIEPAHPNFVCNLPDLLNKDAFEALMGGFISV